MINLLDLTLNRKPFLLMITTEFDESQGILKSKFEGVVKTEEIVEYINASIHEDSLPKVLKILSDARNAEFDLMPKDLSSITEANKNALKRYDGIVDAFVLMNPYHTALSILYQQLSEDSKYSFAIFSTTDAAVKWLNSF